MRDHRGEATHKRRLFFPVAEGRGGVGMSRQNEGQLIAQAGRVRVTVVGGENPEPGATTQDLAETPTRD